MYEFIYFSVFALLLMGADFILSRALIAKTGDELFNKLKPSKFKIALLMILIIVVILFAGIVLPSLIGLDPGLWILYFGAVYLMWQKLYSEKRWAEIYRHIARVKLERAGISASPVADLSVRKLAKYLPVFVIHLPFAIFLVFCIFEVNWVVLQRQTIGNVIAEKHMFLLTGVGFAQIFFYGRMKQKTISEPVDLRSSVVDDFRNQYNLYLRDYLILITLLELTMTLFIIAGGMMLMSLFNPKYLMALVYSTTGMLVLFVILRFFFLSRIEKYRWDKVDTKL